MEKFIVSSLALRQRLQALDLDLFVDDDEIRVRCDNGKLTIGAEKPLDIEAKFNFEKHFTVRQLRKLSKLCGMIEEQPIVVKMNAGSWLYVDGIML